MKKILETTVMASGDHGSGIPWNILGPRRLQGTVHNHCHLFLCIAY